MFIEFLGRTNQAISAASLALFISPRWMPDCFSSPQLVKSLRFYCTALLVPLLPPIPLTLHHRTTSGQGAIVAVHLQGQQLCEAGRVPSHKQCRPSPHSSPGHPRKTPNLPLGDSPAAAYPTGSGRAFAGHLGRQRRPSAGGTSPCASTRSRNPHVHGQGHFLVVLHRRARGSRAPPKSAVSRLPVALFSGLLRNQDGDDGGWVSQDVMRGCIASQKYRPSSSCAHLIDAARCTSSSVLSLPFLPPGQ